MISQALIHVVDDDPLIGLALAALLRSAGYTARRFTSPSAFLAAFDAQVPGCVVSDLVMPQMSGLELQIALAAHDYAPPIVFLTGQGDIKSTAQAMKAGAVDVLCKPVQPEELLAVVREAVAKDAELRGCTIGRRAVRDVG